MDPTIITAQPPIAAVAPQPRRRSIGIIAAAIVVVAIIGIVAALNRKGERVQPTVQPPTAPKDDGSASRESAIQIATASTLANLVARRELSPEERVRFTEASSRLDMAKKRVESRDYAASTALATEASATFRDLLSRTGGAPPQTVVAQRPETTKPAVRPPPKPAPVAVAAPAPPIVTTTTAAPPPQPQPQPAPVVPKPEPQPPVVEPVKPAEPSRAELEHEIRTFVREMAAAYQEKDVAFFRRRARNYNDQMGRAIANSPSVKVEMTVNSIQFGDDGSAAVAIRRVDTFAEAGAPPGVQNLTYELRRGDDGWQIISVSRR